MGEAEVKVTERKAKVETGDGTMDASEATIEGEEGRGGREERVARERRTCSAWRCRMWGGKAREGEP